jgi:hypothetical protein
MINETKIPLLVLSEAKKDSNTSRCRRRRRRRHCRRHCRYRCEQSFDGNCGVVIISRFLSFVTAATFVTTLVGHIAICQVVAFSVDPMSSKTGRKGGSNNKIDAPVILVIGACALDRLLTVSSYPVADAKIRSNSYNEVGGGNAANTASGKFFCPHDDQIYANRE